jgi:hypothetical protein
MYIVGCGGGGGGGGAGSNVTLTNLQISSSELNPLFDPNTTGYASHVDSNVLSVTVTPTAANSSSKLTVNGQAVSSGTASQPINLTVGSNTITIVVIAQDGTTTKTYTLTVTRNNCFWTWVSGDSTDDQSGVYGVKGIAADTNIPGARYDSVSWTDNSGNFWLFGGAIFFSPVISDSLNDLWKFDGTNWTWVSGDSTVNQNGIYGTKGVAAATNNPVSRVLSISWTDSSGDFWLFSGVGFDSEGNLGDLNDLWKFSP